MRRRENFIPLFVILFICACVLYLFSSTPLVRVVGNVAWYIVSPITSLWYHEGSLTPTQKLQQQNAQLLQQIAHLKDIEQENKALKDQFQTEYPKSYGLLPAKVVGAPSFVPGVHNPLVFIINKGSKDGVQVGQAVVVGNTLIGKVAVASDVGAKVLLVTHGSFSLRVKTANSQALGVLKGEGGSSMIIENVLLSESISTGDVVVTYGDVNEKGFGIPEGLVVGKIISIDKKPSAVFQMAKLISPLDFSRIFTVFVIKDTHNE